MKEGPDIAYVASLIGDPARTNMLLALMDGCALTISELAEEAGVSLATASSHIAKLEQGGLVSLRKDGRNRFASLADAPVGEAIENLMNLASRLGHWRARPGGKAQALKCARICYDHLAGEEGVWMYDRLRALRVLTGRGDDLRLTRRGETFVTDFGVDLSALRKTQRPFCRSCRDWSEQRDHLGGALGTAFLQRVYATNWATREPGSRAIRFTPSGIKRFRALFA